METKEFILVASGIADQNNEARMAIAYETVNEDNTKYLLITTDPFWKRYYSYCINVYVRL